MRYYEDPAVARIDPKKFADFSGTYELAPVKRDGFFLKAKICMSNAMENANNFCLRDPKSFSAKASKAASYFATRIMEKWTRSSIGETTKTSSGAG